MNLAFIICQQFVCSVNMLNADSSVQCNTITIFLFLFHLYQLYPMLRSTDIIRQHNPVVKREIFLTEYLYFIRCIRCPVTFYKAIGARTCTNYYYLLLLLVVPLYLY